MPATRQDRKRRANVLHCLAALLLVTSSSELETLAGILAAYKAQKCLRRIHRGPRGPYGASHSEDFLQNLLHHTSDRRFKVFFRMDRGSFEHIAGLIQNDPVFFSSGQKPQRPPWYQLAVFLNRFGLVPIEKTAEESSIAEGTVYLYCARVVKALRRIRPRFLSWPDHVRKAEIKERMAEEDFPGCIGMVDGSLIRLAVKPVVDGEIYFCRKKFYAIILQAVCDDNMKFLEFDLGWPGNVQDTTVFRESGVWRSKGDHFEHNEYILADKGYPLTKFTIRPFAESDLSNDPAEARRRREFNYRLSRLRITIEHAFGMLKGRFPALRNMPGTNLNVIFTTVEALMVIHNILVDLSDDPTEIEEYNGNEDVRPLQDRERRDRAGREIDNIIDTDLYRTGLYRRKRLMQHMNL